MFKRILLVLMLVCFMVGTAFAGITEMCEAFKNDDYTTTISEANKVIADENAKISDKAKAQHYIASCDYDQKKYTEAITKFQTGINTYPTVRALCAIAQSYIGSCYYNLKDYPRAITEYQKIIDNYPDCRLWCVRAQMSIAITYGRGMLDEVKKQEALCKVCIDYPQKEYITSLESAFKRIEQRVVGNEKYAEVLNALVKLPSNENTAELLGRVGSQMAKPDLAKYFE